MKFSLYFQVDSISIGLVPQYTKIFIQDLEQHFLSFHPQPPLWVMAYAGSPPWWAIGVLKGLQRELCWLATGGTDPTGFCMLPAVASSGQGWLFTGFTVQKPVGSLSRLPLRVMPLLHCLRSGCRWDRLPTGFCTAKPTGSQLCLLRRAMPLLCCLSETAQQRCSSQWWQAIGRADFLLASPYRSWWRVCPACRLTAASGSSH